MKILLDKRCNPLKADYIKKCIAGFVESYNATVWEMTRTEGLGIGVASSFGSLSVSSPNSSISCGHVTPECCGQRLLLLE